MKTWTALVISILVLTGCAGDPESTYPATTPEQMAAADAIRAEITSEAEGEAAEPEAAPEVPPPPESNCLLHIELHDGAFWARELGRTEMWVLANHRINLFASPGPNKGQKLGEMRVGSRAVVLAESDEDYQVRSPLDDSVGWVSKIQVAQTLHQNVNTFEACTP